MTGAPSVSVRARIGETIAILGYLPVVAASTLAERNIDAADHLKRSTIKDVQSKFPGKRDAGRFIANRIQIYGSKQRPCLNISDAVGGAFIAGNVSGESFGGHVAEQLEDGGDITSSKPMYIPFKRVGASLRAKFGGTALRPGNIAISRRGLVYQKLKARGALGERTKVDAMGVLRKFRHQRKLLDFQGIWDNKVEPKFLAKLDRDLDRMLTVAGQEALASEIARADAARTARSQAFTQAMQSFLSANPGNRKGAVAAAVRAAKAVRSDPIGQKGKV